MTWGAEAGYLLAASRPLAFDSPEAQRFYEEVEFESYLSFFDREMGLDRDSAYGLWNNPDSSISTFMRVLAKTGSQEKAANAFQVQEFKKYGAAGRPSGAGGGATVAQRAAQITAELRNMASQFGVIDYANWDEIGRDAANNNWSAAQVRDLVASYVDFNAMQRAGYIRDIKDKAIATGSQYFVKLNNEEILNYARQIAADDMSEESLLGVIRERAKAQFSWLSDVIDSGTSLQEYFKPHREEIARLLEVSPEAINFMDDPKWQKIVQRPTDAQDNSLRSMSLFETQQYVRGLEEWKATNNARSESAKMAGALAEVFGGI